jgi:hypothetical protein
MDMRATYEYGGFVSASGVEFDVDVVVQVALEPWETGTAVIVPPPLQQTPGL